MLMLTGGHCPFVRLVINSNDDVSTGVMMEWVWVEDRIEFELENGCVEL
jgi:hypothetical protein